MKTEKKIQGIIEEVLAEKFDAALDFKITDIDLLENPGGHLPDGTFYGQCWLFEEKLRPDGYGRTSVEGRQQLAHRSAYEALRGPIPEGLVIDHLCRVRHCFNPWHLEPVTGAENIRRGLTGKINHHNAAKTHCPQGHSYEGENLYIRSNGSRECRTCQLKNQRDRNLRKKLANTQETQDA